MTLPSRSARLLRRGLVLSLLLVALTTLFHTNQPTSHARTVNHQPPQRQRPLDPLNDDERQKAARIAQEDTRARSLLGAGRQRLISVELADAKPPESAGVREEDPDRPLQTARLAEVIYLTYDKNEGVRVVVDLDAGRVRDVSRLDGRGVPLTSAEVEEAAGLALRDTGLRSLLGDGAERYRVAPPNRDEKEDDENAFRVEGLRIIAASPRDPCYNHRCVALLFRRGRTYLTYTEVIVDLTSQKVRVERKAPR